MQFRQVGEEFLNRKVFFMLFQCDYCNYKDKVFFLDTPPYIALAIEECLICNKCGKLGVPKCKCCGLPSKQDLCGACLETIKAHGDF